MVIFYKKKATDISTGMSESGMAYIAILILLAVLSTLGFAFIYKVGTQAQAAMNRVSGMQASYLAEAAANHAMWRLLNETVSTVELRVSHDDDDASEEDDGDMRVNDDRMELGKWKYGGVRFLNVPIPQGASITNAYVRFRAEHTHSDDPTDLTIWGDGTDDASRFTSSTNDISSRTKTAAAVTWNGIPHWTADQYYQTPDFSSIIQEIVNRPGWASGNAMAVLFESTDPNGKRCVTSHDKSPADAPLLHIEYGDATIAAPNVYHMHSFGGGRYGYKIRYHTSTTFATIATVGAMDNNVVNHSYVLYVIPKDWYDPAWLYRQKITILPTVADTDHTDFPYLIKIDDSLNELFLNAQTDGDDILFTASDGTTQLDHEIEKYDSVGNELFAWVKIPLLNSTDPTVIYMYYNNASASNQENPTGVWSNGYVSVYHLHDDFKDALNSHNGTNSGSTDVLGQVADAQDFYPSDGVDSIDLGNWNVSGDQLTIQAWIKSDDNFVQNDPRVVSKATGSAAQSHVWMMSLYNGTSNENRLRFRLKTGNSNGSGTTTLFGSSPNGYLPDANEWYLVAMTYDGSRMRIIRDGLDAGSTSKSGNLRQNNWTINIGNNPGSNDPNVYSWDGKLDEVRVSSAARPFDWMKTEYRNQGSPGTYQSIDAPETRN